MGPLSGRSAMEDETDLANFALDYAMKKGVSYAEARYEHQEQENFILKNGVLEDEVLLLLVFVPGAGELHLEERSPRCSLRRPRSRRGEHRGHRSSR